jgi:CDP-diacylglycerol--glycerol-3-phosphate 3-phosphatidyltransferase
MLKHLPNILTISRIIVIPLLLLVMYFDHGKFGHRLAAGLFLYACITDFFDGFLARAWSIQTKLGQFLDPIADKLLVGSVILVLVHFDRADLLPAIAIICREILVSGLREFLAEIRVSVPVSELAKVKTFLQMAAIFILVLGNEGMGGLSYINFVGNIALWLAAGLTLVTGYVYLRASIVHLTNQDL